MEAFDEVRGSWAGTQCSTITHCKPTDLRPLTLAKVEYDAMLGPKLSLWSRVPEQLEMAEGFVEAAFNLPLEYG